MKSFFRFLLLGLILATVALISALTSMRLAIHGRQMAVPSLVGLSPEEATRRADESGLRVEVEQKYYSPNVPAGKIVSQAPEPGAQVRRGWRVLIAESLGPQRVSPPDVVGQTERAAEINIRRRGLQVSEVAIVSMPGQEFGKVIAQNPPANAGNVVSPNVSLLAAAQSVAASYVMPNLAGSTLASATQALKDAGMHVGAVSAVSIAPDANPSSPPPPAAPAGPASIIVSQSPAPGQRVQEGASINFEVRP